MPARPPPSSSAAHLLRAVCSLLAITGFPGHQTEKSWETGALLGPLHPVVWGPPQSPWNVRSPGLCTAWSLHTFGQEGGTSTATPTSSTFPRPAETPKGTHTFVGGRLLCMWAESREPCPPGEAWGLLWRVQWGFDSLKEAGREPWPDSTTYPSVYPVRRCLWAPSMRGALPGRGEDLQGCSVRDA